MSDGYFVWSTSELTQGVPVHAHVKTDVNLDTTYAHHADSLDRRTVLEDDYCG